MLQSAAARAAALGAEERRNCATGVGDAGATAYAEAMGIKPEAFLAGFGAACSQ